MRQAGRGQRRRQVGLDSADSLQILLRFSHHHVGWRRRARLLFPVVGVAIVAETGVDLHIAAITQYRCSARSSAVLELQLEIVQHLVADPACEHAVGDRLVALASRAPTASCVLEQHREVDAVVVVLFQGESAQVGGDAFRQLLGAPLEIPQLPVDGAPQAERLGVVGRRRLQWHQNIARGFQGASGVGSRDL